MKNLMVCNNANKALRLNESESTGGRYILEGLFAGPFGVENRNKRIYQADEYLKHLQYLRDDIKNGEPLLGELDHPEDRFEVKMKEVSHRVIDLWYDKASNTIQGKIELLNTPNGKLAQSLVDQGIPLHISSRAAGSVNPSDKTVSIQQIYTFDLVCKPGFAGAVLHRVNESEDGKSYTKDVYDFLTESERMESLNTALQFGMVNEDVSITEVESDIRLRDEARVIKENNNTDDMVENKNGVAECGDKTTLENHDDISEKDKERDENQGGEETNDDTEKEDTDDSSDEKETEGVKIISVRAETTSGEGEEDVDIEDVKAEDDEKSDDDESDKEESDEEGSDDDIFDDDTKKDECADADKADECGTDECDGKDKDKKDMLFDCDEVKKRKEKFEDKLDSLIDSIKTKGDKKKTDESHTIQKYPMAGLLNKSNFRKFMKLSESEKSNVITYLQMNRMMDIESVNENWEQGIGYKPESDEVWFKYAPDNYRKMYLNASDQVRESIRTTASFMLFESQSDVVNFWENTGIAYSEGRNVLNENFIKNMPKIVTETDDNNLPYGSDFIKVVTDMACEYN